MEIAADPGMPTYSGGLGVLAGDTIRSAADLELPMVAVTLLHRRGYFLQRLTPDGTQIEDPVAWRVEDFLIEQPQRVTVQIERRPVQIRCWRRDVVGLGGFTVPLYLLDTHLPENSASDRDLSGSLYGGDARYRLAQETVLGIGGIRMLRALGYVALQRYHMNEGHSALLTLELLREQMMAAHRGHLLPEDIDSVRQACVFTTHTPVAAGHDQFAGDMVRAVLEEHPALQVREIWFEGRLNLTHLALFMSRYVNGVSMEHGEVSRQMFASYAIEAITNGVHAATWTAPEFQALFDRHLPAWRLDNFTLRYALRIPDAEIDQAHAQAKLRLIDFCKSETNVALNPNALTLGFARRAAAYKRADLLLHDLQRLDAMASNIGPMQLVYAGKAHPADNEGKAVIRRVLGARSHLKHVKLVYVANYDMTLARLIIAGIDVWVNTPQPPLEASGTSGMKAALNGVPSLSVLDGWWIEGHIEGITGWAIGSYEPLHRTSQTPASDAADAKALYDTLEHTILPLFYREPSRFTAVRRSAIALNGAFFTTQRMLQEYVLRAYGRRVIS
jgi:starch phosphorylase